LITKDISIITFTLDNTPFMIGL